MTYLLDTSWIIQLLAGHTDTVTFHKRIHPQQIAVSSITVGELYDIAFTYANPHAHIVSFQQFLAPFTMLTLDEPVMEGFAEIRVFLRRRGEMISDFDILIAAIALQYDLKFYPLAV